MMAQFKSNFVAATSSPQSDGRNQYSISSSERPVLRGFVSGGLIGVEAYKSQPATSFTPASKSGGNTSENENQKNSERLTIQSRFARFPHCFLF